MTEKNYQPIALSIAGSDPSAGAGIQADLRMFYAQGVYGTTVLTALTAQTPREVTAVQGLEPSFVRQQIETLFTLPIKAMKTGMLWSKGIISVVAEAAKNNPEIPLVVDPVMIATSGAKLISDDAITCYIEELIPNCTLLTPNLDEAEVLLEQKIHRDNLEQSAKLLQQKFGCAILLKGGHLKGNPIDILCCDQKITSWTHNRIENVNTHGSGCMLSAAITALLAKGLSLHDAVHNGLHSVKLALQNPIVLEKDLLLAGIEHRLQHIQK